MNPNKYQQAIVVITKEQEKIIGRNLAMQLVQAVPNLKFDQAGMPILNESANPKDVLGELVNQYAIVFGRASIEVAKEAVKNVDDPFTASELPDSLK